MGKRDSKRAFITTGANSYITGINTKNGKRFNMKDCYVGADAHFEGWSHTVKGNTKDFYDEMFGYRLDDGKVYYNWSLNELAYRREQEERIKGHDTYVPEMKSEGGI